VAGAAPECVGFIKSWSEFPGKADLHVDDAIVFSPKNAGFRSSL
jgi:hypothetical protein